MRNHSFFVQQPPLFSINWLEQIEEAMLRILEEVGIAVVDDAALERLSALKFQIKANRVFLKRKFVLEFLDAERKARGDKFAEGPQPISPEGFQIRLSVHDYPRHLHDIATDKIVPLTTERLIEAAKLVDVLSSRGIVSSPPGCPADVPPSLQPVMQYWVGATFSRQGRQPVDPKWAVALPYVMEMAEVLGNPFRQLNIWVFSPLTLGGESLRCAMKFKDRLSSVRVSDMPSVGCTAPINIGDAFALAAAEVIGSAILIKELFELPVKWRMQLCPIDLRTMAMVLGTPEAFLLALANSEVNAYFHGTRWYPAAADFHTNAKLPGAQACAEKASLMTVGALLGARRFGAAGTLSLDEVFSPEQLLYDLEIKDHVQRLVQGIDGDCLPERCLQDVSLAVKEGSFAALDSTLKAYRQIYWHPKLFSRQFLAAWEKEGAKTIRQKTHKMIRELLDQHEYRLEDELQKEIDRILARAKAELV